jgi:hypothetical protein
VGSQRLTAELRHGHGINIYSLISSNYFHWSSLCVSCQRIYDILNVDKSSNNTLSIPRPTYNSSSTTTTQFSNATSSLIWSGLSESESESESELLYDWRFTANQFVLTSSPLRLTTRYFFISTALLR